jgi:hypothetical protein
MSYYEENKEKCKAYSKKYNEENAERIKIRSKEYYQKNREKILQKQKEKRGEPKPKRTDVYKFVRVNDRMVLEHRYIWEYVNGEIPKGYVVHHLNGDIQDNRIENLICISRKEHYRLHKQQEVVSSGTDYYGEYNKSYIERNRDKWNQYQAKYKKEHYIKNSEKWQAYYEKNKENIKERARLYYQNKKLKDGKSEFK